MGPGEGVKVRFEEFERAKISSIFAKFSLPEADDLCLSQPFERRLREGAGEEGQWSRDGILGAELVNL